MQKKYFILFNLLFSQIIFSQVGIGTTNPSSSSALEIKSSNSGLLIPRITLNSTSDITTIPSPATSLLVYNTNTVSDVTPGFYYWEGSWKKINNSSTSALSSGFGWTLSGNTLSSSSEFLGTNNYYPLIFKVNNNQFSKFHPNGGIAIGNSSVANDNNSIAIGTSTNASSSNEAIAIGKSATASGFQSISLGLNANSNTNSSVAIGNNSSASGQQATSLGTEANASGQNATAIGYQANASQSNSIILGNASNTSNKIGIGTNTPDERLHIAGSIKIVDGTQANDYVLTSDANGKASWKDPNNVKIFGEIYRASNLNLTSGIINFGTSGINTRINLNTDNIQVTKAGIYKITYTISLKKNSGPTNNVEFYLGIYGAEITGTRTFATVSNGDTRSISFTKLVNLSAYQAVSVYSNTADSTISVLGNGSNLIVELVL